MRFDVVVVGGGLAGLSAARDLASEGTDVVLLEGRGRPGGRVLQTTLEGGRIVQWGGEVFGASASSYRQLVNELDLTLLPAFPGLPGADTTVLIDGHFVDDDFGWMEDEDKASYEKVEAESAERTSLLADLRKEATVASPGFYSYDHWEAERVAEGSATVVLKMADELGHRIQYETVVTAIDAGASGCSVLAASGERFDCGAAVCALLAGPLRRVLITGVSDARLGSLRRHRHALASKAEFAYPDSFWEAQGQNGSACAETGVLGGTWPQREGILSALVPAERLAPLLAGPPEFVEAELIGKAVTMFGEQAADPVAFFLRHWCVDPMTEGYITAWRPGDAMAVGPLHGSHEPTIYVCGSDRWACDYMEGAVRMGRAAASAALHGRTEK